MPLSIGLECPSDGGHSLVQYRHIERVFVLRRHSPHALRRYRHACSLKPLPRSYQEPDMTTAYPAQLPGRIDLKALLLFLFGRVETAATKR
jgi:hypothetical protein